MIQAIETRYSGCRFRSRLEARWAVFFDKLKIPWEYEKEGFDLGEHGRYLPDFWLPSIGCWFEVKGPEPSEEDCLKMTALGAGEAAVVVAVGGIGKETMRLYAHDYSESGAGQSEWQVFWGWCTTHNQYTLIYADPVAANSDLWIGGGGETAKGAGCCREAGGTVKPSAPDRLWVPWGLPHVDHAKQVARSARFEFGERGLA